MGIDLSFFHEPTEVIEFLKQKRPKLHFDYDEIMHHAHDTAFTIAKITKLDLLKDIQNSLTVAMQKGLKFEEWKENITPTLAKKGWLGKVYVVNPKNGEFKRIHVNNRRLKTIYDTNMRTAYAKAEYETISNSHAKYIRYIATLDSKTRPSHAQLHNLVLPKNDPFWDTNYPPNAWNCRCQVRAVFDDKELKRRGLRVNKRPKVNVASKDWAFHVGKTDTKKRLMDVYKNKVDKIKDEKLKAKAKESGLKMLSELAKRLSIFKAIKQMFNSTKKQKVQVAETDIFGKNKPVFISSDTILSHTEKHPEITAFEYSLIPRMLEGKKIVFKDGNRHLIIIKKLGIFYRLVIKNIEDKDEIFVVSLAGLSNDKKNIARIIDHYIKKYKVKGVANSFIDVR